MLNLSRLRGFSNSINTFFKSLKLFIWKDKFNRLSLIAAFGLVSVDLFLIFFSFLRLRGAGEAVALRYNVYFGVDLVGSWPKLFFYPLSSLGILCLNFIFSARLYKSERLLSYFMSGFTLAILTVNLLTLIFVLILNLEFIPHL